MGSVGLNLPRLQDYDICPTLGFVPFDIAALRSLNTYYQPWEELMAQLSTLLASNNLREEVRRLPVLSIDKLQSDAERRRAYTILSIMTQAYVFADAACPESIVPAAVSVPFLEICEYWGIQPVLTHAGYDLWNWRMKDGVLAKSAVEVRELLLRDLDNVEPCGSFTSTQDEKAFHMVPLLVEVEGGCMVEMLLDALRAASTGDMGVVVTTLNFCIERLVVMAQHLKTLHEQCDPQFFYHTLRPYIMGSRGMETKGLSDGFVFELANGQRVPTKCVGASAGQNSLFQVFDHVFGIEHKSVLLQEMRAYMPRKHREFLVDVEKLPALRSYVQAYLENETLQTSFGKCIELLRAWRTQHIGVVTRYIVMPARQNASQDGVRGTGGSLPIPFLKETRDETV